MIRSSYVGSRDPRHRESPLPITMRKARISAPNDRLFRLRDLFRSQVLHCATNQIGQNRRAGACHQRLCHDRSKHAGMHEEIHYCGSHAQRDRNHPSPAGSGKVKANCGDGPGDDACLRRDNEVRHRERQHVALKHRYQACGHGFRSVFNKWNDFLVHLTSYNCAIGSNKETQADNFLFQAVNAFLS